MKKILIISLISFSIILTIIFTIILAKNGTDENMDYETSSMFSSTELEKNKWVLVEYPNNVSFSYPKNWNASIFSKYDTEPSAYLNYTEELVSFNANLVFYSMKKEELAEIDLLERGYFISLVLETNNTPVGIEYSADLVPRILYEPDENLDFLNKELSTENLGYLIGRIFDYKKGSLRVECRVSGVGYESYKSICDDVVKSLVISK